MNLKRIIFSIFFVIMIITLFVRVYTVNYSESKLDNEFYESVFRESLQNKGERLQTLIVNGESDAIYLSNSDFVKNIFKIDLSKSSEVVRNSVEENSEILLKEIENYFIQKKIKNLDNLRNDSFLKNILFENSVGKGYNFMYVLGTDEFLFYPEKQILPLQNISFESDENFFLELSKTNARELFYSVNFGANQLQEKYLVAKKIPIEFEDNKTLFLFYTVFLEDYKVIENFPKNMDNDLKKLLKLKGYHNILFLSSEGNIVYMSHEMSGLGENIYLLNFPNGFLDTFSEVRDKNNGEFYGPFFRHLNDTPKFSYFVPIYEDGIFLGEIVILFEMDSFYNILTDEIGRQYFEDFYLVNKDSLLISPLFGSENNILVQKIETVSAGECLEDLFFKNDEEFEARYDFLNFRGDSVLGFDYPLPNVEWCLLLDVDSSKFYRAQKELANEKLMIIFSCYALIFLFVLFLGIFCDKKYRMIKKKENVCSHSGLEKPFVCFLFGGGCNKESWPCILIRCKNNFLGKLKLRWIFLINFLIIGILLSLLFLFFGEIFKSETFFDIFLIFILSFLFFLTFKFKDIILKKIFLVGSFIIIFEKTIEIFLQEYQVFVGESLNPIFWLFEPILLILGVIFISWGMGRLVKK